MPSYRHIFRSTGLLGSVQALSILISILRNKLAAVLIGAAGMGLSDLYQRTLEFIGNATNFGLGLSAVKRLSEIRGETDTPAERQVALRLTRRVRLIRTWVFITALLGTLLTLLTAPLLSLMTTGGYAHTTAYALLSPVVGLLTFSAGEAALLKALHRLRPLARAGLWTAVGTLVAGIVCYGGWGMRGIVPMIVLSALCSAGFTLRESLRDFPYRIGGWSRRYLLRGVPMLRLGLAYIVAGMITALAEILIRTILMRSASGAAEVGYYAAGVTLTVSYARLIFVALDADYFPTLAATGNQRRAANLAINRQMNALVVLMAPFLIAFALGLPLIIRLLYTADFLVILPMVLCAAPYMYFKAVYTPIAYLPLARGDGRLYVVMEGLYDVVFCLLVTLGYQHYGLIGAGLGLSLSNLFDLGMISLVYSRRYGYRINRDTLRRVVWLFVLLIVGL
ncbi:MAG: oligosaccharide flippase family protein, partial [Rothia sp. (in: high G+C Gram-positive bacteria)]|uniref:oligosaccharide flippase family protein n=1 Tax=Rothia sp. (in: high G+C Gram-positive bacteria) TaxID=1885016 RepID=UPI0026DED45C